MGSLLQLLDELSLEWKMTVLTGIGVGQSMVKGNSGESLGPVRHLDGCVVGLWEGRHLQRRGWRHRDSVQAPLL